MGYSPWGHKESDMTERLHFSGLKHLIEEEKKKKKKPLFPGNGKQVLIVSIHILKNILKLCPSRFSEILPLMYFFI